VDGFIKLSIGKGGNIGWPIMHICMDSHIQIAQKESHQNGIGG